MNAIPKTSWQRLRNQIADNVRHGAPLEDYELEPAECVDWIDQESENDIGHDLTDAMAEAYMQQPKVRKRLNELAVKLMKDELNIRDLNDWIDLHRKAMVDMCSQWARREVAEDLGL